MYFIRKKKINMYSYFEIYVYIIPTDQLLGHLFVNIIISINVHIRSAEFHIPHAPPLSVKKEKKKKKKEKIFQGFMELKIMVLVGSNQSLSLKNSKTNLDSVGVLAFSVTAPFSFNYSLQSLLTFLENCPVIQVCLGDNAGN
jgi:hypothetical protein